jgi:anaerobic magnesium-protoporphyrin IX monomethyl ester cyclase
MNNAHPDNKIDILLTYPKDGFRLFQSMIPIGLISIGTVLKRAGYRVAIIDFNHYANDFQRQIAFLAPKIIGVGGTTPSRSGSFLTAKLSKKILPESIVVYGGINATFTSTEVLENVPEIDFILKGEGDLTFLRLCNMLLDRSQDDFSAIPGLCRRSGNRIIENKPERIQDLSVLPIPDRDMIDDNYDLEMEFLGGKGDFIMTSRGCPTACNFCSASRMFPGGVRYRSIGSVMDEIEYLLTRKKLSGLKLFDSTFTSDRDHVENFCAQVIKFNIPWECEIRADTVDFDMLKRMKDAGCYYINIGMETSNQSHLKHISKGITPAQVLSVLAMSKNLGIRSKVFFTFGHIGQTFGECLEDVRFIESNREKIDFFAVTVGMRIYPGTRMEKECREKGLLGNRFSWMKSAKKIQNLLLVEPSDVPLLFQKQLGPFRLSAILVILFGKRLMCTEKFLLRMVIENIIGTGGSLKLAGFYFIHKIERIMGRGLKQRAWAGIACNGKSIL